MAHLRLVSALPQQDTSTRFGSRDLIALTEWSRWSEGHGYPRVLIESGGDGLGAYALVYQAGSDWASWGLAPDVSGVLVWHCGSGADVGRFPTMAAALASLPPGRATVAREAAQPVAAPARLRLVHSA